MAALLDSRRDGGNSREFPLLLQFGVRHSRNTVAAGNVRYSTLCRLKSDLS
jgi:hypothetical protein